MARAGTESAGGGLREAARAWRARWDASIKALRRRRGGRILPFSLGSSNARLLLMLLLSLVLLVATFWASLSFLSPEPAGRELSLGHLRTLADGGRVREAVLYDFDHRIAGVYADADGGDVRFFTDYPRSDTTTPFLIEKLIAGGAEIAVQAQTDKAVVEFVTSYLLPLVILANLFALIFIGAKSGGDMGGLMEFGGIGKDRQGDGDDKRITFADVAGAKDAVVELREIRDYLTDPERFASLGARPPKGILMAGPPGTGKTLMARAVAGEAGVPFFSVSGSEFVESLVGVGAARVRDLFRQVRAVAPAIVFIDEVDAAGRKRGSVAGGQEEREQTLNQLLIEMDGFDAAAGVVVIAATNRPDILDPALLRPGRFDRQVTIDVPDVDGRAEIIALYLGKRPHDPGIDVPYIARRTPGFAGADLSNLVNEAALLAIRQGKPVIDLADLEEAIQRVMAGPRRRGHLMSEVERKRSAHHEAAHVVVGAATGRLGDIPRVSIMAHGRTLGGTGGKGWAERTLITRSELFAELTTLMAGGLAEERAFGEGSTGSDDDLDRATQLAHTMVGRYGMTEALGKVRLVRTDGNDFLGGSMVPAEMVSEQVLTGLHQESRRLIDEAAAAAGDVLDRNSELFDRIVALLLDHDAVEGAQLEPLVRGLRPPSTRSAHGDGADADTEPIGVVQV